MEEDRWRKEEEERAAAEALQRMPLREQLRRCSNPIRRRPLTP